MALQPEAPWAATKAQCDVNNKERFKEHSRLGCLEDGFLTFLDVKVPAHSSPVFVVHTDASLLYLHTHVIVSFISVISVSSCKS